MKESNIGMIIFGFFILAVLVAGGLFLYHVSRSYFYNIKEGTKIAPITNKTDMHQKLYHEGSDIPIDLAPDETKNVYVKYFEHLTASGDHPDGETLDTHYQLTNSKVNRLYVTVDGFRTNLSSSEDVKIINNSDYPVIFVQESRRGGSKWVLISMEPRSVSEGHFIGFRSVIYVAYANTPHIPITETLVGHEDLSTIRFDGQNIFVE